MEYLNDVRKPLWEGYGLVVLMLISSVVYSFVVNRRLHEICRGAFNAKCILIRAVYDKVFFSLTAFYSLFVASMAVMTSTKIQYLALTRHQE